MEAKELRVTNLILNDGVVNVVIFIGYDSVQLITKQGNNITARLELIKPIPLTSEWLVKFGFKDIGDITFFLSNFGVEFSNAGWTATIRVIDNELGNRVSRFYHLPIHFHFVHELQNLYFALTGEELTITEPKQ